MKNFKGILVAIGEFSSCHPRNEQINKQLQFVTFHANTFAKLCNVSPICKMHLFKHWQSVQTFEQRNTWFLTHTHKHTQTQNFRVNIANKFKLSFIFLLNEKILHENPQKDEGWEIGGMRNWKLFLCQIVFFFIIF